ncbi:MAG TPA: DUF2252 family protein [Polyangiaceae bacterium]
MTKVAALLLALFGCSARPAPAPVSTPAPASQRTPCADDEFGSTAVSFTLRHADLRARGASRELLSKLAQNPYVYFRAVARPYELRTCAAFRDERWHLPLVAIHADAHLEQFVVTPTSAGLEDFDQSAYGPAVVDLVRYAASIRLACRGAAFDCDAERAVGAYFDAYRSALDHQSVRAVPSIVERLRRDRPTEPLAWLAWAEGLFRPLHEDVERRARRGWREFRDLDLGLHPERQSNDYEIVRIGRLEMGVGSVLETKLLLRLRGPTADPADDVVVEARAQSTTHGKSCASRPQHGGALQPLMFMSLLGPRLPSVFGFAPLGGDEAPEYWVVSWTPGYRELSIQDLQSERELIELAEHAAHQLAGHFWTRFPEELRAIQRQAQLRAFDRTVSRARAVSRTFADETISAWQQFRAELAR